MARRSWMRMVGLAAGVGLLLLWLVGGGLLAATAQVRQLPDGVAGPEAEALAAKMVERVDGEAWARTRVVRWTMFGHRHVWDRQAHTAQVRWGNKAVWLDLSTREGRVEVGGEPVDGERRRKLLDRAHAFWVNDSFWLNPVVKAFDEGTTRALVERNGRQGLMVSYASGGLTPGDSYLWWVDETGLPERWQLWVSVIPVGGLSTSWAGWVQLESGAWVATEHRLGPLGFTLTEVSGE